MTCSEIAYMLALVSAEKLKAAGFIEISYTEIGKVDPAWVVKL